MESGLGSNKKLAARRRGTVLIGAVIAAIVFGVYLDSLAPTVLYYRRPDMFDSVMLQAAGPVLGMAHPTGYSTYMMMTHLFTYLPVGDPAYRVNLASAVYGVAAVILVYAIGVRLTGRRVAAAVGALAFGFSDTFWDEAVIAEVYTLNAVFISATVLTFLIWRDRGEDRWLLLAAFLTGLSLTHHLTSGLLIPAGLFFVLLVDRRKFKESKLALRGIGLFFAGLLPLLYLPLRAMMFTPLNEADPSTLGRFILLITSGSFMFETQEEQLACNVSRLALDPFPSRLSLFSEYVLQQFPLVLLFVGALAAFYMLRTDRAGVVLLGTIFAGCLIHGLAYLKYGVEDFYIFLIPAYLMFAIWISLGAGTLLRAVERMPMRSFGVKLAFLTALSIAALVIPLVGAFNNFDEQDRSNDYKGRKLIRAVEQDVKPGATVLHHRSSLWYMVLVEDRRRDLTLMDPFCTSWKRYNDVVWPDNLNSRHSALRYKTGDHTGVSSALEAAKMGPVYILRREFTQGKVDRHRFRNAGFDLVPVGDGFLYELVPAARNSKPPSILYNQDESLIRPF